MSTGTRNAEFAAMTAIAGRTAAWRRTGFLPRTYELSVDGQSFARLRMFRALRFRSELETATGAWEFARPGFWSRQTVVRVAGVDGSIATFEPRTWMGLAISGGGTLQFDRGARYTWRTVSFWTGDSACFDENEALLLRMRPRFLTRQRGALVEVATETTGVPQLPILVGFGLHHMLATGRQTY